MQLGCSQQPVLQSPSSGAPVPPSRLHITKVLLVDLVHGLKVLDICDEDRHLHSRGQSTSWPASLGRPPTLTTFSMALPAASSTAVRFARIWCWARTISSRPRHVRRRRPRTVCSRTPPSTTLPVAGSVAIWPEQ